MPLFKKRKERQSRFLVFNILKMTFLVPLTILFITEIDGPVIQEAVGRSITHFSDKETAFSMWGLLILVNVVIYLYLRPVLCFNRTCRRSCEPDSAARKKAAKVFNNLPEFILWVSIIAFSLGGFFEFAGSEDDMELHLPFIYTMLESIATGFFAGVVMYINTENLLFPSKKLVFTDQCKTQQKYSSFYIKLLMAMTAVVFFLFFQVFDSLSEFYMLGGPLDDGLGMGPRTVEGAELFEMSREHEGLKDVMNVLFAKTLLLCFYVLHILREIKKMFKNPLETVQEKLEGLNSDNPELSHQIDIVNNDEFTAIYREINELIDKQNLRLKMSEERLEKIVEKAADPIISFHKDGSIHVFNPAASDFFGYTEEEALTMNMIDLIDLPESVRKECEKDRSSFNDFISNSDQQIKRFTGRHKEGSCLSFESNVSLMDTDHGSHYTAIIRDVAAQIEFEDTLKSAKTAAENANRMKSEFLANMSHELRTPLNAVLGFTQLLSTDKNLTGGQLEKINTISRSGEHLLALINDILDISKIESGKTEMHQTIFDLNRFVYDLKDMFILKCQSKGLSFYVEHAGDIPPYVIGDLGKLRQIMINLIGNAVKFTSEGGISLLVGEERGKIRFSVSDTGKGIPKEEIGKILQPFMQSSNVDHEGGTGLGLAISNSFIGLMGGALEIDSELGKGSSFSFSLPLETSHEAPEAEESRGRVVSIKNNRAVKALIVDDKVNNRLILKTMLENVGFVTMEAENGLEAVERTGNFDPEMIFMDIKMPVMDGYEAVEKLKSTEQGRGIKIFALTASAFRHDEKRIFESGFDGFLPKPFKLESLFKIIADETEVEFNYEENASQSVAQEISADELDFRLIASLLNSDEIEKLDDNILINDFAAIKEQALSFGDREELKDFIAILTSFADNFNDSRLEELMENIRNANNG